jgi:hypothetical protein
MIVRELCNLGYARRRCPRFPSDAGPDAIRFAIKRDAGEFVAVYWVRERDHEPFDHGALEYSLEGRSFAPQPVNERLGQQAEAYLRSYLRRKAGGRRKQ